MRIGIDARELRGRATGVGRYLGGLLQVWSAADFAGPHTFFLYTPEAFAKPLSSPRFETRIVPGKGGTAWEQRALPDAAERDNLDVFFAPAYTAPLSLRTPLTLTIHDVSFAAHPEWFTLREGLRRRLIARRAASHARAIVTVSHFSRSEIVTHLGVPDSKIHVIPEGITRPDVSSGAHRNGPSILYVGSIFNRRHVPELLRAFKRLHRNHSEVTLDLVGDNRTYPYIDLRQLIDHLDLTPHVRWHEYVADEQLARLYGSARAFAFLSQYEGFGLTPLEAISVGVPPVLLDTPVAREICGDAALYVQLDDVDGITRALERLLFDDDTRRTLATAAPAVLQRYDSESAARSTLEVMLAHA